MTGVEVVSHPLAAGVPPEWASAWGQDAHGVYASFTIGAVTQRLRWIPPGEFLMGSLPTEHDRHPREAQHAVVLTRGYWLADTACTQALWREVLDERPSHFSGDERPVEQVSYTDVVERFLPRLNDRVAGLAARLPTEAEWEYACRAGTTTPFWFGEDITPEQVNYDGNFPYRGGKKGRYRQEAVAVGTLPPNAWGLYEMHGNVLEWCADWYAHLPAEPVVDPQGPATGSDRVLRGGSWFNPAGDCRSAQRIAYVPGIRYRYVGFRVARGPD